jgi:aspartyl-tRNA(Asn)/glutamyl-tRNA(Gln) amidotransferase subunit A
VQAHLDRIEAVNPKLNAIVAVAGDALEAARAAEAAVLAGVGASPDRPLRVGWLVEPGFGPIDSEVAATVQEAAKALQAAGCLVEPARIPALERDNSLDVFSCT